MFQTFPHLLGRHFGHGLVRLKADADHATGQKLCFDGLGGLGTVDVVAVGVKRGRRREHVGILQLEADGKTVFFRKAPVPALLRVSLAVHIGGIFFLEDPDAGGKACRRQEVVAAGIQRSDIGALQNIKTLARLRGLIGILSFRIGIQRRQSLGSEPRKVFFRQIHVFPELFAVRIRRHAEGIENAGFACRNRRKAPAGAPGALRADRCYRSPLTKIELFGKRVGHGRPVQLAVDIIHILPGLHQMVRRGLQFVSEIVQGLRFTGGRGFRKSRTGREKRDQQYRDKNSANQFFDHFFRYLPFLAACYITMIYYNTFQTDLTIAG